MGAEKSYLFQEFSQNSLKLVLSNQISVEALVLGAQRSHPGRGRVRPPWVLGGGGTGEAPPAGEGSHGEPTAGFLDVGPPGCD